MIIILCMFLWLRVHFSHLHSRMEFDSCDNKMVPMECNELWVVVRVKSVNMLIYDATM